MTRLTVTAAFAVATLALAAPMTASAADNSADSKYKYPPYGQEQEQQQSQSGGDYARAPDGGANAPPAGSEDDEGPGASGERDDGSAYQDGAGQNDADRPPGPEDENGRDRAEAPPPQADEPPPPHQAEGPPPRDYGGLPRIEATASAPDRNIPYDIRRQDARHAAIEAWRGKVAERFGREFSHWRMAEAKRVDCMPERNDGVVCIASGTPVRGYGRLGQWQRRDRY